MLRVCTNVQKKDGTRAIGTYIPRTNPDGKPNPVIASVLQGETYQGRASVVNKSVHHRRTSRSSTRTRRSSACCIVGVPQESVTALRASIMGAKVGKTGYVYVLDSKGNYVISVGGKRDGECIWEAKDADGRSFIQEICKKAVALKDGGDRRSSAIPGRTRATPSPGRRSLGIIYFEPWDWVIGVGSYMDEFYEARDQVTAIGARQQPDPRRDLLLGALVAAIVIWFFMARSITGKIHRVVDPACRGRRAGGLGGRTGLLGLAVAGRRRHRAGGRPGGDLLQPGRDGLHDQAERRQRPAGQQPGRRGAASPPAPAPKPWAG